MAVLVSPIDNLPELTQIYYFCFYCFFKMPPQGSLQTKSGWRTDSPHAEWLSCGALLLPQMGIRPGPAQGLGFLGRERRPDELGPQLASQASFSQAKTLPQYSFQKLFLSC